jgi:NAD(P)-dependent dehydrogenase (short-subunit alcohol dehydrogenase family)
LKISLAGKTAIVTASTQGIGLATARGLSAAGAAVVINSRDQARADAAAAAIAKETGGVVRGVGADMGTVEGCAALTAAVPSADIVISNQMFVGWGEFFATGDDVWRQAWETNVVTGARLARHYLPGMKARGWGRFVFISSESARNIQPELIPYGASKLALHALSRGIAKLAAGSGVTSNVVMPGPTLSDGVKGMLAPAVQQGVSLQEAATGFVLANRSSSVLKRMASVDEVASMIIYVCSPQASATSGSVLRVDGGVVEDVN